MFTAEVKRVGDVMFGVVIHVVLLSVVQEPKSSYVVAAAPPPVAPSLEQLLVAKQTPGATSRLFQPVWLHHTALAGAWFSDNSGGQSVYSRDYMLAVADESLALSLPNVSAGVRANLLVQAPRHNVKDLVSEPLFPLDSALSINTSSTRQDAAAASQRRLGGRTRRRFFLVGAPEACPTQRHSLLDIWCGTSRRRLFEFF